MNIVKKIVLLGAVAVCFTQVQAMEQQADVEQNLTIKKADFYDRLKDDVCHSRSDNFKRLFGLVDKQDVTELQSIKSYSQQLQDDCNDQIKKLRPFPTNNKNVFALDVASTVSLAAMAITIPVGLATNDTASFYTGIVALCSALGCCAMRIRVTDNARGYAAQIQDQGKIQKTIDEYVKKPRGDENV